MSDTEDADDDSFQSVNNEEFDVYETDDGNDEESDWITLNGCSKITRWQYPPNETRCTEINCSVECGNRFAAIEHYKEQHAANMILCYICDIPIHAKVSNEFERHFIENHPTTAMPFIFNSINSHSEEQEPEMDKEASERDEEDEKDDLIRLSGCGKITCWLFPKHQKICPIETCEMAFMSRSDAIQHYKDQHSNNSIFCYLCEKPILALQPNDFKAHYDEAHSNIEMAFSFDEKPQPQTNTKRKQSTDDKKTKAKKQSNVKSQLSKGDVDNKKPNDDDIITLNGCGYVSQWRIPQTDWARCPIMNCKKMFKLRSHAILHFKRMHASDSICCSICNRPVLAQNISNFVKHFENHGENDLIILRGCDQISQWRFPHGLKRCPVRGCAEEYTTRPNAIAHYKSEHAKKSIYCNLCDRPYVMKHAHHFIQHFRSKHINAAMPYHFKIREWSRGHEETNTKPEREDMIQLKGCGEIVNWTFPKTDWQKCQIFGCRSQFQCRSDAIAHFKAYHTENSVLCLICNKPIRANYPANFRLHYRTSHPNVKIPYEFKNRKNKIGNKNPTEDIASENADDDEEETTSDFDDLITLNGCGYITQWKFPEDLTQCPRRNCGVEFSTRKALIAHYKEKHSDNSILCSKCNKPISVVQKTYFARHFNRIHPNEPLPFDLEKYMNTQLVKSVAQNDSINDLITLTGGGKTTFWRFPKLLTKCPVLKCRMEFNAHSKAVAHFKELHASGSIHCSICDRPIRTNQYVNDFVRHHIRMHPTIELPYGITVSEEKLQVQKEPNEDIVIDDMIALNGWGQTTYWQYPKQWKECPVGNCRKSFKLRLTAIAHYKKEHSQSAILCSLCDKPICVNNIEAFQTHYQRKHPGVEVPSEFTAKSLRSTKTVSQSEPLQNNEGVTQNEHNDVDDVIILRGRGQNSKWHFPNTTQCPAKKCLLNFNTRSEAIDHYKRLHAGHYTMCLTCKKPISVSCYSNWKRHCLTHPNAEPTKQKTNVRVPNTDKEQTRIIPCPLKDCSFRTIKKHKLRTHWDQKHGSLRFPEIRDGNSFDYSQTKRTIVSGVEKQIQLMDFDSDGSLLKPIPTDFSSSDESQHKIKIIQKVRQQKKLKRRDRNKRQRTMGYSYRSTYNETSDEEAQPFSYDRKRKLAAGRDDDTFDVTGVIPKREWPIKTEICSEMDEVSPNETNETETSFIDTQQEILQQGNSYTFEFNGLGAVSSLIPKIIDVKSINMNQDPQVTSNIQVEKQQTQHFQASLVPKRRNSW